MKMDPNRSEHHDEDFGAIDASMISSTSPYQPTTERVPDRRPFVAGFILNMQYIKSLAGVLKMIEIVLDIIVAICLGTVGICSSSCSAVQFLQFVCISAMIFTTVIFVIYAFNFHQKIEIINWPLTDLINNAIYVILYIIGSCFMAAKAVTDSGKAATAFGFLCVILYGMSLWRAYQVYIIERKKRQSPVSHIHGVEEHTETQDLA